MFLSNNYIKYLWFKIGYEVWIGIKVFYFL